MSAAATAALVLQCFFDRPADGSVPADSIPRVTVPVSGAMAESMVARRPPENRTAFAGEAAGAREWLITSNRDPAATSFTVLRVSLMPPGQVPVPFAALYGTVTAPVGGGGPRFEQKLKGNCDLRPADGIAK